MDKKNNKANKKVLGLYDEELSLDEETSEDEKKDKPKGKLARLKEEKPGLYAFLDWIKIIVIAVVIALLLNNFVIINSNVPTGSMEPTIMAKSRTLGLRLTYLFTEPERGDVVVFYYPDDPSQVFVKRIIGEPLDTVEIINGKTYVNGIYLEEPYLNEPMPDTDNYGPYVVPEGCYLMLGDNRNHSQDARYWENTYVKRKDIMGKVYLCYWPLGRIGVIK